MSTQKPKLFFRRLKWLFALVAAVIAAFFAAAYIILLSYDYNALKPFITQAVRDATGRELTIAGDIELDFGLTPAIVIENVSFQNASWGSRPELVKVKRLEVEVSLLPLIRKNIYLKRLVLLEPDALIETDSSGRSNLRFDKEHKTPVSEKEEADGKKPLVSTFGFEGVFVEKGVFYYRDGGSGNTFRMELENLEIEAADVKRPARIRIDAEINGKAVRTEGTVGPLMAFLRPDRSWSLDLKVKAGGTTCKLDGSIKDVLNAEGMDLNISVKGESITEAVGIAGVTGVPQLGPFRLALKAVDSAPKTYKLSDLDISVGDSDLAGFLEIRMTDKPYFKGRFKSKKLDLRPVLSKSVEDDAGKGMAAGNRKRQKRVFPEDELSLEALKRANADVEVECGTLLFWKMALDDLKAVVTVKDGAATANPIKARIGGGSLDGQVAAHPDGMGFVHGGTLSVKQLNLGQMLNQMGVEAIQEGELRAEIDLHGRGGSIAEIMAGLNAKVALVMGEGRMENRYIRLLGADLTAALFRMVNPVGEKTDFTEFNCMVVGFDIKDGLATSTALVCDTSTMTVVGTGKVDLKTEGLDVSLRPSPKGGLGSSGTGKLSLSLSELTRPFKLGGSLADPKLALDPMQSAVALGKAAGGVLLFGPVGIAAALARTTKTDKNPCVAAIEAAEKGVEAAGADKKSVKGIEEEKKKESTGASSGPGRMLKKLFGD